VASHDVPPRTGIRCSSEELGPLAYGTATASIRSFPIRAQSPRPVPRCTGQGGVVHPDERKAEGSARSFLR
jgi:hypothetical protein